MARRREHVALGRYGISERKTTTLWTAAYEICRLSAATDDGVNLETLEPEAMEFVRTVLDGLEKMQNRRQVHTGEIRVVAFCNELASIYQCAFEQEKVRLEEVNQRIDGLVQQFHFTLQFKVSERAKLHLKRVDLKLGRKNDDLRGGKALAYLRTATILQISDRKIWNLQKRFNEETARWKGNSGKWVHVVDMTDLRKAMAAKMPGFNLTNWRLVNRP